MIIAIKLGPYYLGVWGLILLLRRYFQIINCGIPDSITILLVQNKYNKKKSNDYEINSICLTGILCICVCLIALYYYLFGISFINKYELNDLFYFVSAIAIVTYLNDLFCKIYRVKGLIFEIIFYQSIVQISVFIIVFYASGKSLLYLLLWAYLIGNLLSLLLFVKRKKLILCGNINFIDCKIIFNKGIKLFFFNFFFYMIFISTQTIIGTHYQIKEFGYFTFAYTFANALVVIIDAMASLIVPKMIDRLNSKDIIIIEYTIKILRDNYIYVIYGLMCFLLIVFTILLYLIPEYLTAYQVLCFTSLSVALSTNSYGYSTFLMAKNKEKIIAINSLIALIVNIIIALFLVIVINVDYQYVIIATLISYFLYAYLCIFYARKYMYEKIRVIDVLQECFPIRLFIPFLMIMMISIFNSRTLIFLPFLIFLLLNFRTLKSVALSFKKILYNPNIIDV
jgi:O-antigen/teichoic acid export membrane protein